MMRRGARPPQQKSRWGFCLGPRSSEGSAVHPQSSSRERGEAEGTFQAYYKALSS